MLLPVQFRRTAGSEKLLSEIQRRHRKHDGSAAPSAAASSEAPPAAEAPPATDSGLWRMVQSVKSKAAKLARSSKESSAAPPITKPPQHKVKAALHSAAQMLAMRDGGAPEGAGVDTASNASKGSKLSQESLFKVAESAAAGLHMKLKKKRPIEA
jgi:hypothetical protein